MKLVRTIRIALGINKNTCRIIGIIASCYILLNQLDEAYRYIKLSRELCDDYFKKPSTSAFILMCLTYTLVTPQYHDILKQ